MGPPSSEGTEAICRVPSGHFSQAPWYTLPDHLCRFRVRSIRWGYFLEPFRSHPNPIRDDNTHDPSHTTRPTNINVVPIDYPLRARLRGRLTLRGLALRRNPWSFGERASHPLYRYSCLHSHFRYLHDHYQIASQAYGTLRYRVPHKWHTLSFGACHEPRYIFAAGTLV